MENTAKNFALQLGSLVSLYISVTALITLLFGVVTLQYPDIAAGYWESESAMSAIRFSIAMLVVFFPAYLVLTRVVNSIRRLEEGVYLSLTKWLIYLSLLIGGAVILGDLVMVINAFLNGELTIRFVLKALVFLLVVGSAFVYYILDAKGHWQKNEKASLYYAGIIAVTVLVSLVLGYMHIETPTHVREMRIDDNQVSDLMNIQSHIDSYVYTYRTLPASIEEAFNNVAIPTESEARLAYSYTTKGNNTYTLCAEFAFESLPGMSAVSEPVYYDDVSMMKVPYNWEHGAGEWCFERTADIPKK